MRRQGVRQVRQGLGGEAGGGRRGGVDGHGEGAVLGGQGHGRAIEDGGLEGYADFAVAAGSQGRGDEYAGGYGGGNLVRGLGQRSGAGGCGGGGLEVGGGLRRGGRGRGEVEV